MISDQIKFWWMRYGALVQNLVLVALAVAVCIYFFS
jgi:hypothetical protein